MTPLRILAALVLMCAACKATTSGGLSSRVRGLFGRFFDSARRNQVKKTCNWLTDPSLLKELKWAEQVDLDYGKGPNYKYPAHDVAVALSNDPAAAEFLKYLTQCYNYGNQTYHRGWNQKLYTQDLCPVRPSTVETVRRYNHIDRKTDHCYVVHPHLQRVNMAQCGDGLGHPDSQKCKRDEMSYFQGNYYCVPDGYVRRTVLIYCPWDPEIQCIPAQVRIPTGCSCKQYTCDKTRSMADAVGSALPSISSITSRFRG